MKAVENDDDLTCIEYLSDPEVQRDAVMGTFLFVYIQSRSLDHNEAGRMIASNSTLRGALDALCKKSMQRPVLEAIADVLLMADAIRETFP